MGPRVQKVLPTVLISHNYTITKRKVFQHTPRLLPPRAPPHWARLAQCQLRVMEMSIRKRMQEK